MLRALLTILALVIAPAALAQDDPYAPGKEIIAGLNQIVTPNGVQETFEVTLGGARQVVNVRGSDRSNPILLFIHGGPGAVEMPIAWSFQRPWEDYFTVVQWDQRGAGRSYPLNDPATLAPTLKPERYRDDAIELIEQLRTRYGKRKVFVVGHSWGSAVGLMVAAKRPDLLYAYIGMGQMIDARANERLGFAWTLEQAHKDSDHAGLKELEALQPYPGTGPLDVAKMSVERKWSIHYGALAAHHSAADYYFHIPRLSPEYTPADRKSWDEGSAFTIQTMWPLLADLDFKPITRLKVPVILFLGRHDYTTPWPVAEAWMKRLQAPRKRIVWLENSAHLMMIEEPGRVFAGLIGEALPLAKP